MPPSHSTNEGGFAIVHVAPALACDANAALAKAVSGGEVDDAAYGYSRGDDRVEELSGGTSEDRELRRWKGRAEDEGEAERKGEDKEETEGGSGWLASDRDRPDVPAFQCVARPASKMHQPNPPAFLSFHRPASCSPAANRSLSHPRPFLKLSTSAPTGAAPTTSPAVTLTAVTARRCCGTFQALDSEWKLWEEGGRATWALGPVVGVEQAVVSVCASSCRADRRSPPSHTCRRRVRLVRTHPLHTLSSFP